MIDSRGLAAKVGLRLMRQSTVPYGQGRHAIDAFVRADDLASAYDPGNVNRKLGRALPCRPARAYAMDPTLEDAYFSAELMRSRLAFAGRAFDRFWQAAASIGRWERVWWVSLILLSTAIA